MIDLHCHILPALDDGPADLGGSLAIARAMLTEGVHTVAATPHVSPRYPLDAAEIADAAAGLGATLAREGIELSLHHGAEIAPDRLPELDDQTLRRLALGDGDCLLVESPLGSAAPFMEQVVFDLQLRGFRPLLAHPERSPLFQRDPELLRRLVGHGALCSITAGSMSGSFGRKVRKFTSSLLREEIVHCVASDAHDAHHRPPGLRAGFSALQGELPGIAAQLEWLTEAAPAAILHARPLPPRPRAVPARASWRRRLLERAPK